MRCSSCELLLDAYLEATLRRRQVREVALHLQGCRECDSLMNELRIVDALLATARSPGSVNSDFTAAVVSATRHAQPHVPRRVPLWLPVLAYLGIAWALVAAIALRSHETARVLSEIGASGHSGAAAIGAALRAVAPASVTAAAAVTAVLLVDLFLVAVIFFGYRRLRPMLAVYLTRGPRS
jgi:hypothetical protein